MDANTFINGLKQLDVDFYTGVPDSLLKPLNDTLLAEHGLTGAHVVAANEGGAVGLAAGHYIATGHPAMVYMQNSGIGNIVNPVASLLNDKVYGIPCVFVVGWRGAPGVKDEPQHAFQGIITKELLELLDLAVFEIDVHTTETDLQSMLMQAKLLLDCGKSIAFLVHKDGLSGGAKAKQAEAHSAMLREEALSEVLRVAGVEDAIVSTTGKTSREVFELRALLGQGHANDFLTVGSMGHAGMLALGMAKAQQTRIFWCLDGDGAALMHAGSLAVEVQQHAANLIHVLLNNAAHESVGGMPVAGGKLSFAKLAKALGYERVVTVSTSEGLAAALAEMRSAALKGELCFVEVLLCQGSRADLGRPTQSPTENLHALMQTLREGSHQ